jgi:hypothetical protein
MDTPVDTPDNEPLPDTVELLYEHTRGGPARQQASADAIDAKAVQIFAAASVVLGLGTLTTADLKGLPAFLYVLAAAVYAVAGWAAWHILHCRSLRVVDGADRWWPSHREAETAYVREQLLEDLAGAFTENRRLLDAKSGPLDTLLLATAVEAVLVAAAVVTSLA